MKRTWMWCLVGLLSLGSAALSQDSTAGSGTEKAVAALEQQWLQSQKTNNPDLVAPLLADKFINTGSDGKVTGKAESDPAFSVTWSKKTCRCSPGKNLKKCEIEFSSRSGFPLSRFAPARKSAQIISRQ